MAKTDTSLTPLLPLSPIPLRGLFLHLIISTLTSKRAACTRAKLFQRLTLQFSWIYTRKRPTTWTRQYLFRSRLDRAWHVEGTSLESTALHSGFCSSVQSRTGKTAILLVVWADSSTNLPYREKHTFGGHSGNNIRTERMFPGATWTKILIPQQIGSLISTRTGNHDGNVSGTILKLIAEDKRSTGICEIYMI